MRRMATLGAVGVCWCTMMGCDSGSEPKVAPPGPTNSAATNGDKVGPQPTKVASAVKIDAVTIAQFTEKLTSLKGKPVVVDHWATWCAPCVKAFPKFVKLQQELGERIAFVSASHDEVEDLDKAKDFLVEQHARSINVLLKDGLDKVQQELKWKDEGIPRYFLFDAAGKLAFECGPEEFDELETKLRALGGKASSDIVPAKPTGIEN